MFYPIVHGHLLRTCTSRLYPFSRFQVKRVDILWRFLAVRATLALCSTGCCYVDVMQQHILVSITCLKVRTCNQMAHVCIRCLHQFLARMEVGVMGKPYLRMLNLENNHDTFQRIRLFRVRGLKVLSLASIFDILVLFFECRLLRMYRSSDEGRRVW